MDEQKLQEMERKLEEVYAFMRNMRRESSIPFEVDGAIKRRLDTRYLLKLQAPLAAITAPSGGATVDSAARTAINSIITRMEDLKFIDPN